MVNQNIRVVLLTTSFPLRVGSASGVFVQSLVKSFPLSVKSTVVAPADTIASASADREYKLHCFRYAPRAWQKLAHQPGGIPVALKKNMTVKWLLPVFFGAMFFACLRAARKSNIVHANWSVNGAIAGLVGMLLHKPVVTTVRGEDVTRAKHSKIYRYILHWCLKSNYKLVAVSEAIIENLVREFPRYQQKIMFLPNGVDADLFNCHRAMSEYRQARPFRLITVGSLITRKGIDIIVNAFSLLDDLQNFELSIVGSGPELEILEGLVKSKALIKYVRFVGSVPPEQVAEYLCAADAFVLASYSEGRPNVVLEAFAVGLPVIATDIEGVRELVKDGETGLRFQSGNFRELAKQIERLQKTPELQVLFSNKGREFIQKNQLVWTRVGQRYADLYQEAIQQKAQVCAD